MDVKLAKSKRAKLDRFATEDAIQEAIEQARSCRRAIVLRAAWRSCTSDVRTDGKLTTGVVTKQLTNNLVWSTQDEPLVDPGFGYGMAAKSTRCKLHRPYNK